MRRTSNSVRWHGTGAEQVVHDLIGSTIRDRDLPRTSPASTTTVCPVMPVSRSDRATNVSAISFGVHKRRNGLDAARLVYQFGR